MPRLALYLLGSPRIEADGVLIHLGRRKSVALLAYLAAATQPISRDELAALLWPDLDQQAARAMVRHSLTTLNRTIGKRWFALHEDQISLSEQADLWVDVRRFRTLIAQPGAHGHTHDHLCEACVAALAEAVELHSRRFLAGFSLTHAGEFEAWQTMQGEALQRDLAHALAQLAHATAGSRRVPLAIEYARRWVALDPLHEPAQRTLMALYAQAGERAAALQQYDACVRVLTAELGVEPEVATRELAAQIEAGIAPPGVRLPVDVTPFIGRARELQQVAERLANPACRLLTILGPGGIGKTRLAVEAARGQAGHFPDGIVFADLAAVGSPDLVAPALLHALGAPANSEADTGARLAAYLRPLRLLLLLDNFEHLLAAGALLVDLLHAAPGVKLLATSRARLNLAGEWLIPLEGMEAPPESPSKEEARFEQLDLEAWDATRLFGACVARVRPGWAPTHDEAMTVARICRLLDGNPLGIELAAAWVRSLEVGEIANEMERSLAFLSTPLRDVAPRHRSMAAVFDHSWGMLEEKERAILRRLSIFRGGWTREAACGVAGAELADLAGLVDRSWVQVTGRGRYGMHEAVRQYCEEQLNTQHEAACGEPPDAVRRRHCTYYGRFLHTEMPKMNFAREALDELMAEFGNTEAGLRWAAQYHDLAALRNMAMSLYFIADMHGWQPYISQIYQTVSDLLEPEIDPHGDVQRYQEALILQVWLRWPQSDLYHSLGALTRCRAAVERNLARLACAEPSDDQHYLTITSRWILTILTLAEGDFKRAYALCREMRRRVLTIRRTYIFHKVEIERPFWLANCDTFQGLTAWCLGDYAEAEWLARRAQATRVEIGERRFWANHMGFLIRILQTRGEYAEAEKLAEAALEVSQSFGDRLGVGYCGVALGGVLRELGRSTPARDHLTLALAVGRQSGQMEIFLNALAELGRVELGEDNPAAARRYCEEGLAAYTAAGIAHHYCLPAVLNVLGWTELAERNLAHARRVFARVAAMPGCPAPDRMDAQAGLAQASALEGDAPSAHTQFMVVAAHPHTSHILHAYTQVRLAELVFDDQ